MLTAFEISEQAFRPRSRPTGVKDREHHPHKFSLELLPSELNPNSLGQAYGTLASKVSEVAVSQKHRGRPLWQLETGFGTICS